MALSNQPFKPVPYKVPLDQAERLFAQLRSLHGWSKAKAPVRSRKRSGRTQFRFVAELPADISPHARLAIVRDFCSKLETLETNAAGEAVGMMYTAVIHAPDAQNDRRNYHLHLIAYDRPCRYLPAHGEWDFAVVGTYLHKGQERTRHPYRQNKLTISQSRRVTGRDGTGQDYPKAMREMFAGCVNEVLERYKSDRRFHPGTYADCGIERGVTEHLGRLFAAEQIGVATDAGDRNAAIICADREREIRVRNARRVAEVRAALEAARSVLARHARTSSPALRNLRERHAELASEAETFLTLKLSHDLFRLRESNARSRAEGVLAHCEEQLSGRASHTARARKEREHLIRRRDEAQSYLRELDFVLAAERARLDIVTRSFAERDARLTRDLAALQEATDDARALPVEVIAERVARVVSDTPAGTPEAVSEIASAPVAEAVVDSVERTNSATDVSAAAAMPSPVEDTAPVVVASSAAQSKPVTPAPPPAAKPAGPEAAPELRPEVEGTSAPVPTSADNPEVPAQSIAIVSAHPAPAAQAVDTNPPDAPRTSAQPVARAQEASSIGAGDPLPALAANEVDTPAITRHLPPQGPVRAAGSPGSAHRQIDALIKRVINERMAVVRRQEGVTAMYLVPALEAELGKLRKPSEIARIQAALRARHRIQEMEIDRLTAWIVAMDPADRSDLDRALAAAPEAIQTLHSHWFDDQRVRALTTALERSGPRTASGESPADIAEPQQPIAVQLHDDVAKGSAPSGNVSASPDTTSDENDEIARFRLLEAFSRGPSREGR